MNLLSFSYLGMNDDKIYVKIDILTLDYLIDEWQYIYMVDI